MSDKNNSVLRKGKTLFKKTIAIGKTFQSQDLQVSQKSAYVHHTSTKQLEKKKKGEKKFFFYEGSLGLVGTFKGTSRNRARENMIKEI